MEELLQNPMFFRGIERILICSGGIFAIYLGYRLFVKGHTRGKSDLAIESKLAKFVLSGQGPGLFFMALGILVLCGALLSSASRQYTDLVNGIIIDDANSSAEDFRGNSSIE